MNNEPTKEKETTNLVISSDQAFDMLPAVCKIFEKLDLAGQISKIRAENKAKGITDAWSAGKNGVNQILNTVAKNIPKIKDDFFEIVSIGCKKPIEDCKKQKLGATMAVFFGIFADDDLIQLFTQAMPQGDIPKP